VENQACGKIPSGPSEKTGRRLGKIPKRALFLKRMEREEEGRRGGGEEGRRGGERWNLKAERGRPSHGRRDVDTLKKKP
jgi:hypothetical protein